MIKNILHLAVVATFTTGLLSACTQTTPTMMNTSKVELARETSFEQIPLRALNDRNMTVLAEQYRKYGSGPVDLTMTYNPKSSAFTAMKAVNELKNIQAILKKKGVSDILAQTLAIPDGTPTLMVAFDTVQAQAPSDCAVMPGMENNETDRFIGDYKFGCGVETIFAKQIARPADLEGNADMGPRPARRESIIVEDYSAGVPRQPLDGIERDDLASQ